MRQGFEIFEIFGFWREISNITHTRLEYMVTHIRLEFFPAKISAFHNCISYFRMGYTFWRLGCGKQMKTKGTRPEGIVFTNADPRYSEKLDDPQGGDATMLMQQVREVMTVNLEMTDESSWIWLTSDQMGFPLRSEFANENHGEAGSSKQCDDQRTDQTAFFLVPIITDFIRNTKRELYDEKLEDALEMLDLEWMSRTMTPRRSATG